jgi:hypothetical protein
MAFDNIGLQEPSTITKVVAAVTIARGSTTEHQEIMVLGDVSSSNAIARVLAATPASTEFGLAVRVIEQPSTVVTVSTGSVRVHQSSAADLNVTVAGYSTTVNVSAVAGNVAVRPSDTNWASSAGFHFDSSGALNIAGTFSASTTVNVSSVSGTVTVTPASTNNSSVYLPVRLTDGTSFMALASDYIDGSTQSTLGAPSVTFNNSSNNTFRVVGLTTPFPVQVTDSSNAPVKAGDSANNAIRVNVVAGAAGGSTIVTVSTGSVRVHQSTAADLQATVAQASTVWAVQVGGYVAPSTIVTVSTGSVRVHQSSAADLNVTVAGYSTTVNVSSVAGVVIVRSSAANAFVTAYQSTAADFLVTATIGANLQSTVAPSSGSSGLVVRQVVDVVDTFASTSALASTTVEVQSSAASLRSYVTAYTITSTNQTPAHWGFFTSNTLLWPLTIASISSAVSGANLAVSPPGYLFRTGAGEALNFKTAGSTSAGVQLGVSFFRAP